MTDALPLFVEVKPSKLKLYFLIVVHVLAVGSVFLISDFDLVGFVLKTLLILLLVFSLKYNLRNYKNSVYLYLKADNLVDLNRAGQEYNELKLSGKSYVSDIYLQLILSDENTGVFHEVSIFSDSLDSVMHSQLRARLKISLKNADNVPV